MSDSAPIVTHLDDVDERTAAILVSDARDYWRATNRRHPCPQCGHRGYCEVSVDGRWCHCMYHASDLPWSKRQGGYLHRLAEATGDDLLGQASREAAWAAAIAMTPPALCADIDTLDAAYRLLHDLWPLCDEDLALLTGPAHGLSVAQARALCATVPDDTLGLRRALNALIERFGVKTLLTVPGFYMADNGHLACAGADLLFFRRDVHGRVTGAQIRLRRPREGQQKYIYLTSTRYGGPTPGSAPHVAHPQRLIRHGEVWITEGIKKAVVAADALGVPVIGLLGVGTWRQALAVVRAVAATTVVIALDQDTKPKATEMVGRCQRGLSSTLVKAGYTVKIATWPADTAKGLDDLLLGGHTPAIAAHAVKAARLLALAMPVGVTLPALGQPTGLQLPALSCPSGAHLPEVRL